MIIIHPVKSTPEPPPVEAGESRPTQRGTRCDPTPAVDPLQRGPAGRGEGHRTVEGLRASCFVLRRGPDEKHLLIRAMLGGALDEEARDLDEDAMVAPVRTDLVRLFGLRAEPAFVQVTKWDRAIRQYELGHLYKVAAVKKALAARPGLLMAGSSLLDSRVDTKHRDRSGCFPRG